MNQLYIALCYFHETKWAKRKIKRLVMQLQDRFPPRQDQASLENAINQTHTALYYYRAGNEELARINKEWARHSLRCVHRPELIGDIDDWPEEHRRLFAPGSVWVWD